MSWFSYGNCNDHSIRKGVWLRYHSNPDLIELVKKSKNKRFFDTVIRVVVKDLEDDGRLTLEIWCKSVIDSILNKNRYNVFFIGVDPNPEWICEGDLGRGLDE